MSRPLYCSFCNEDGNVISDCNSPEVHRLCEQVRERAFTAYAYKSEHHLLHVFLCYPADKLEMLATHWMSTCNPDILQYIYNNDHIPTDVAYHAAASGDMSYSKMVALNMWLYLYVEIYQLQDNSGVIHDELYRTLLSRKTFWFNVWMGGIVWYANHRYNNYSSDLHTGVRSANLPPNHNLNNIPSVSPASIGGDGVGGLTFNINIRLSDTETGCAAGAGATADDNECPICYNELDTTRILPACGHSLCSDCFEKCLNLDSYKSMHSISCSICRSNIHSIVVFCPLVNKCLTKYLTNNKIQDHHDDLIDDELDSITIDLNLFGYI
jgi:hypothetical protein